MDPGLVTFLETYTGEYPGSKDPYYNTSCMEGPDLDPLLAACPKLQRLTLNSVVKRGCGQLQRFLFDAKVRCQPELRWVGLGGSGLSATPQLACVFTTADLNRSTSRDRCCRLMPAISVNLLHEPSACPARANHIDSYADVSWHVMPHI